MDPLIGAALVGAAGSVLGGTISSGGTAKANKANLQIAREQMAFQERMRGTQYQATMKDLEAAGINPILAAKLGGAGTPPGASATMQSEEAAIGEGISKASSSATEAMRMRAEIDNIKAMTDKARTDITNSVAATDSLLKYQAALEDQARTSSAKNAAETDNVIQNMGIKGPIADITGVGRQFTGDVVKVMKSAPNLVHSLGKLGSSIGEKVFNATHRSINREAVKPYVKSPSFKR